MNDRMRELELFLRVAGDASFSAVARSLGVAPSTISKGIHRLESRLGVRLFHRTSRMLKLTQHGDRLLAGAQRVVAAIGEAEQRLGLPAAQATGLLRVDSTPAFARNRLAPIIPEFLARHPMLAIEFTLSATVPDMLNQQIDVSVRPGPLLDVAMVVREIGETRWIICAAPAYLEKAGTPRTIEDLYRHNCLNFTPGSLRSRRPISGASSNEEIKLNSNVMANNGDMLCALACMGLGIVRLADFHLEADLAAGRLVSILDDLAQDEAEPIFSIHASRRPLSPRVRVFLDYLDEKMLGKS